MCVLALLAAAVIVGVEATDATPVEQRQVVEPTGDQRTVESYLERTRTCRV